MEDRDAKLLLGTSRFTFNYTHNGKTFLGLCYFPDGQFGLNLDGMCDADILNPTYLLGGLLIKHSQVFCMEIAT